MVTVTITNFTKPIYQLVFRKTRERTLFTLKKIKDSVKGAVKFIDDYEKVITDLAIENGYDYVVCGHIHQPKMEFRENKNGKTMYLNSGDWIENFTALEYQFKRWKIYNYNNDKLSPFFADEQIKEMELKDLIAAITIVDKKQK